MPMNAPNVDARYVQNLTIHITYHTGASQAKYVNEVKAITFMSAW